MHSTVQISEPKKDPLLDKILAPLSKFYEDLDTVEVRMVRQGFVTTDKRGDGKAQVKAPELTIAKLETICKALSNYRGQKFDTDYHPKLSCVLPGGHRFECVLGDSVQSNISLAIRCKHPFNPTWDQMGVNDSIKNKLVGSSPPIWEQVCNNENPLKSYLLETVIREKTSLFLAAQTQGKQHF